MQGYRDWSNRFSNNKACRGRFSIVDGHGFESILRGAMEVECRTSIRYSDRSVKKKDDRRTLTTFRLDISCGLKVWIIESLLVLGRLLARANQSAPSEGNGRQASSVDRRPSDSNKNAHVIFYLQSYSIDKCKNGSL